MDPVQPLVITATQVTPYQKPFQKPFMIGTKEISVREGLILTVQAGEVTGQGEITPLEGVSLETLKKARHDLSVIKPYLCGLCVIASEAKQSFKRSPRPFQGLAMTPGCAEILDFLRNFRPLQEMCPSVRFGVESAIFNLVCHFQKITLAKFLGSPLRHISTAVLLQGSAEQIMQEAKDFVSGGYKVFKLKVGSRNIPLDVKKVVQLRQVITQDAVIRLDANRAWSTNEAVLFGQLIGPERIEFIEEPLKDMGQIGTFYQKTHLPVALDESLNTVGDSCSTVPYVKAYVLKPTVLGGITVTLDWIQQAKSLRKKAIISSCFESAVGLSVLKNLALLTGEVPGLGTNRWFNYEGGPSNGT